MANEKKQRPGQKDVPLVDLYGNISEDSDEYEEYEEYEDDEEEESLRFRDFFQNKRLIVIIAICAALLVVLCSIAVGLAFLSPKEDNGLIYGHITVAGVDVGGMTQSDAINAVHLATDATYSRQIMLVRVLDTQLQILPSIAKVTLNVEKAVEAAYLYGRTGSKRQQNQEQHTATTVGHTVKLDEYLSLDEDAVRAVLDTLDEKYSTTLVQTAYEVTGTQPSLIPSEQPTSGQVLVITKGVPEYALDLNEVYDLIFAAYCENNYSVAYECGYVEPDAIDLNAIYTGTYVAPVDASLDNQTFTVNEGTCGYGFNLESAKRQLQSLAFGQTLELPFSRIMPDITAEQVASTLYRDILASYTANDSGNEKKNAVLASICNKIDGMIINPGGVFSYNQTIGSVSVDELYSLSSALYYCAMTADLDVLVRNSGAHFTATYMPLGMDAVVDNAGLDLRFRNNTNYPIRIEAITSGGRVTVSLIGTDEKDYYVLMDYTVLFTDNYTVETRTMRPGNTEGYTDGQYIVQPYTGYIVETYRCKYDKLTDTLISQTLEATTEYQRQDGIICRIEEENILPTVPRDDPVTQSIHHTQHS